MVAPPTTPPTEPEPELKEELPPAPLVVTPASPTSKKLPSSDSGEDSSKENKENGNMDKAQLRAAARRKGQLGVFFTSVFYVGSSPFKGSGRGLVVRVLDSGLYGRGFDPHTGRGSLLTLKQFHYPPIGLSILSCK